jgi:hypothetical protein
MDKLVEAINFASNSYWGDPNRFQFKTRIDSFSNQIILEQGSDRTIKTTFDMTLNGYIIPDSVNRELSSINRAFANTQIIFGLEVADSEAHMQANINKPKMRKISSVLSADSTNTIIQNFTGISLDAISYITTNIQKIGTVINQSTVTFDSTWLQAPTGLPQTNQDDFTFFANGALIEKQAIVSFTQTDTSSILVIDESQLMYSLETNDIIIGMGKFE